MKQDLPKKLSFGHFIEFFNKAAWVLKKHDLSFRISTLEFVKGCQMKSLTWWQVEFQLHSIESSWPRSTLSSFYKKVTLHLRLPPPLNSNYDIINPITTFIFVAFSAWGLIKQVLIKNWVYCNLLIYALIEQCTTQ